MSQTAQIAIGIPGPPSTSGEERRHRKQRPAAGFPFFTRFGFDEGVAGHITVRDRELPGYFRINPFGMHFSQTRERPDTRQRPRHHRRAARTGPIGAAMGSW